MATDTGLKKLFKSMGFLAELESLGFQLGPTRFWVYRRRGQFVDSIYLSTWTSGNTLRVKVNCNNEKLLNQKSYDISNLPKGFEEIGSVVFRYLGEKGLEYSHESWSLRTDEDIKATMVNVLEGIKKYADSWLRSIDSDEKLFDQLPPHVKKEDGQKYRKIIVGD